MLPATADRAQANTSCEINREFRERADANVKRFASPAEIDQRLRQLDEEWDVERTIECNASCLSLIGLGLGTFVHRKYYLLPAAVAGFLLQHSIQGWCPPIPILRRMGFRTQTEIDEERYALKLLRGDFEIAKMPIAAVTAVRT